jgi:hypothetical protein
MKLRCSVCGGMEAYFVGFCCAFAGLTMSTLKYLKMKLKRGQ